MQTLLQQLNCRKSKRSSSELVLLCSSFYSQSRVVQTHLLASFRDHNDNFKTWFLSMVHCMKRSTQTKKKRRFSVRVWETSSQRTGCLDYRGAVEPKSEERHESQIRDENNGAAVGETMRAMEQQCCDKFGDDNEGERRVTKLSKSVTIWSLVCLCLQLLLGFGRQKHERVERRIQLQGGEIKILKKGDRGGSLFVDCKNPGSFGGICPRSSTMVSPPRSLQVTREVTKRTASSSAVAAALLGCDCSLGRALRTTPGPLLPFNSTRH